MKWTPESVDLFLDNVKINSVRVTDASQSSNFPNPFQQPVYIIINQAIGGSNGGDPTNTKFPILYEVDYVRVYNDK